MAWLAVGMARVRSRVNTNVLVMMDGILLIVQNVRQARINPVSKVYLLHTGDCPVGRVWWGDITAADTTHVATAECSNAGTCDSSTGTCSCFSGYNGAACERIDCPSLCSGHGLCKPMSELATLGETNGVPNGYTYGTNPNTVSTWDANRIFGCHCDKVCTVGGVKPRTVDLTEASM